MDVYEVVHRYWEEADWESPWEAPKPSPAPASVNLLTATDQGATSLPAERSSAAAAAGALSKLAATAAVFVGWLLMH